MNCTCSSCGPWPVYGDHYSDGSRRHHPYCMIELEKHQITKRNHMNNTDRVMHIIRQLRADEKLGKSIDKLKLNEYDQLIDKLAAELDAAEGKDGE